MEIKLEKGAVQICRICLQNVGPDYPILYLNCADPQNSSVTVEDKLIECVPELNLDTVPHAVICNECSIALSSAYSFKLKCLRTEMQIRKHLQRINATTLFDLAEVQPVDVVNSSNKVQEPVIPDLKMEMDDGSFNYSSDVEDKDFKLSTEEMLKDECYTNSDHIDMYYSCYMCEYTTESNSDLSLHMQTHAEEKLEKGRKVNVRCEEPIQTKSFDKGEKVNLKLQDKFPTEQTENRVEQHEEAMTEVSLEKTREWIDNSNFENVPVEPQRCADPIQRNLSEDKLKHDASTDKTITDLFPLQNSVVCNTADNMDHETVDDDRDADFDINDYTDDPDGGNSETSSSSSVDNIAESVNLESDKIFEEPEKNLKEKREQKVIHCKYCANDIASKNFIRHLDRKHRSEDEVENIFQLPKNSKERRWAFALFRNDTNFELYINGVTRPNRQIIKKRNKNEVTHYPCTYCKGLFLKEYLKRHAKSCFVQKQAQDRTAGKKNYHISNSQTIVACAMDPTDVISKLNVKEQVFNLMKADEIAFEAKKDLLIAHFGESYLKEHRQERAAYACSNRMRELSRLLISYRKITNNKNIAFKDILFPKNFDGIMTAAREISGYDHVRKSFRAPSLAMHLGTSLKMVCEELMQLIVKDSKGYNCGSISKKQTWLQDIKCFKKLIEYRWNTELASLANTNMMEKRWNKPLLLPLVSDIQTFPDSVQKTAEDSDDSDNEVSIKKIKFDSSVPKQKQKWSDEEVKLVQERFKSCIRKKTYPSGKEIQEFIKKTTINRTVPVIKSKIQHLIKISLK